ncbi:MAG: zonular occludens toxin domain-containing protein [Arcobacter sp.]|uniref:zonular occludens toxin domain-containing protein n=1 Tax=Arcobacter sp. TaxID=1872629 RepID=UPI003C745842
MVTLITGFPGSGKTYYAIDKIYNIMSKNHNLSKEIEVIYTNINGLNYDLFPKSNIELKKLVIEDLYNYLKGCYSLYEIYKNDDAVDEHLIKFTKEKGFFNVLIVFDECHDFLSNQDKIKIFWLTYHRHLHHEIDLLTQNKSLINTKYRAIPEIFIEAQPRSKKLLSSTLTYKHFASFVMRKSDQFNKSSIKTKKEVFELYQSGNTSKQKSILTKFILIALLGISLTVIIFTFIFSSLDAKQQNKPQETKVIQNQSNVHTKRKFKEIEPLNDDYYVIKIIYNSRDGYFIYDSYYSTRHFRKFISETQSKILSNYTLISNKDFSLSELYIYTSKQDLKRFFILPIEEEKDNDDIEIKTL